MQMIKGKPIAMICSRCIKEHTTLAWYHGTGMYNNSMLCRFCFKTVFNGLTETQKLEWSFYKQQKKGERNDTKRLTANNK